MAETHDNLPVKARIAFRYGDTDVLANEEQLISLNDMWKAAGSPEGKEPWRWTKTEQGKGFIADLASSLNLAKNEVIKTRRGKGVAGTCAHWQIALAYAKYLSHEFHRFVNEAFREWAEEKADPGLKLERAVNAYARRGKTFEWIERRFKGIGTRKALTSTMADHNCKVRGINDNPFAEATRAISLQVIGQTPKEIKESKGLAKSAKTRDHLDEEQLVSIEWAEIQARKLIRTEAADGNRECVDCCRRAGSAVKKALDSLNEKAG
jgi:hypothetical protein